MFNPLKLVHQHPLLANLMTTTANINKRANMIRVRKCNSRDNNKFKNHHHMQQQNRVGFFQTIINRQQSSSSLIANILMIKQEFLFNQSMLFMLLILLLFPIFNFIIMAEGIAAQANTVAQRQQDNRAQHVIAIKEGEDLDLGCPIVVPNEDMIISWTCDNEPANIRSSRIHVTDSGKLRIKSAKVGDACNYRCEAADGFGTLSMIVKVIIVDKRLIRDKLSRLNNNQTMSGQQQQQQLAAGVSLGQHYENNNPSIESKESGSGRSIKALDLADTRGGSGGGRRPLIGEQLAGQQQQSDLEVFVEPAQLVVAKNRSFSLECKVKHSPHLMVPQIIWLKEFIGPEPNSMREAHEQNLVIIDDVYYHSLNWPRSISYSKQSASVNSALLVRQSNFVHSGRYICFAGYPPSIMSSFTMSFTSSTISSDNNNNNNNNNNSNDNNLSTATTTSRQPLKYKMALAMVKVGDLSSGFEGNEKHKQLKQSTDPELVSALLSSSSSGNNDERRAKNLLISIFSTNSWTRNLTAILTLLCGLIIGLKLIYIRRYRLNNNNENCTNGSGSKAIQAPDATCGGGGSSLENSTDTPILQQRFHLNHQPYQHYKQPSNLSTTIQTGSTSDGPKNSTDCSEILSGVSRQLELLIEPDRQHEVDDGGSSYVSDHLYSEICERDKMIKPKGEDEVVEFKISRNGNDDNNKL